MEETAVIGMDEKLMDERLNEQIDKRTTCCFTGHRPQKLPWGWSDSDLRLDRTSAWIAEQLEDLYSRGYRTFMCGMALGCDSIFADEVIRLRNRHPGVVLYGAIPCADQASKWNEKHKLRYAQLVDQCGVVKIFYDYYNSWCMSERNEFMVDNSSVIISCFLGSPGGTMKTLAYAMRKGLETRIFDLNVFNGK